MLYCWLITVPSLLTLFLSTMAATTDAALKGREAAILEREQQQEQQERDLVELQQREALVLAREALLAKKDAELARLGEGMEKQARALVVGCI